MNNLTTTKCIYLFLKTITLITGILITSSSYAVGYISGQVSDTRSNLIGIYVDIYHGTSAELVSSLQTDENGWFISPELADGSYKVRLSGPALINNAGAYLPEYAGGKNLDVFELGGFFSVANNETTLMREEMALADPVKTVPNSFFVSGKVFDTNGSPVEGISVSFKNSTNAVLIAKAETDLDGFYSSGELEKVISRSLKVRFVAPENSYLPEYYGAGGADDFNLGKTIDPGGVRGINEKLVQISPDIVINDIIEVASAYPTLTNSLSQASQLLNDTNPNNDNASCGVLNGFINQVNARVRKGELSAFEAESLIESATIAQDLLNCP